MDLYLASKTYIMKTLALIALFVVISLSSQAQKVTKLPVGTYQTYFYGWDYQLNKWLRGDIILLSATTYKLSDEKEVGKFNFDAARQRVYFLSGPLKNVFAKTAVSSKKPAIVLPKKENKEQKIELAVSDVWGYLK